MWIYLTFFLTGVGAGSLITDFGCAVRVSGFAFKRSDIFCSCLKKSIFIYIIVKNVNMPHLLSFHQIWNLRFRQTLRPPIFLRRPNFLMVRRRPVLRPSNLKRAVTKSTEKSNGKPTLKRNDEDRLGDNKTIKHYLKRTWVVPKSSQTGVPEHLKPHLITAAKTAGVIVVHTGFMQEPNMGWGLFARNDSGFKPTEVICKCGPFNLKTAAVSQLLK